MSINCDDLDRLLEQRLTGEISADDTKALRGHIDECAACKGRIAADDALTAALSTMPTLRCPPEVLDAIMAATVNQPVHARRPLRMPIWPRFGWKQAWAGMAVASACLAIMLVTRLEKKNAVPFDNDPGSVEAASAVVKWSLVYTAQTLQTSQARVIRQTIAGDLPRTVYSAVSRVPILKGVIL